MVGFFFLGIYQISDLFYRLRSMKAEIDGREADLQRRAQERRQKWQAQGLKTRKLGRLKYPLLVSHL